MSPCLIVMSICVVNKSVYNDNNDNNNYNDSNDNSYNDKECILWFKANAIKTVILQSNYEACLLKRNEIVSAV